MRNTAMLIAALGAALTTTPLSTSLAGNAQEAPPREAAVSEAGTTAAKSEPETITTRDGEILTLETLKNEVEWRSATAEMLRRESQRRKIR